MMRVKFLVLGIVISMLLCTVLSAQPPKPPSLDERITKMTESLALTEAQVEQIRPIVSSTMEKMKALHSQDKANRETMREDRKKIHDEEDQLILDILTDEQKDLYREMKEKRKRRRKPGGQNMKNNRKKTLD